MPAQSALWVCNLWRWLGGALVTWPLSVLVLGPLGRGSSVGQFQIPPVPTLGPPSRSYKVTCSWLLPELCLEVCCVGGLRVVILWTEAGCNYCQAWGSLARGTEHAEVSHWLFQVCRLEILGKSQHEPSLATGRICLWKNFGLCMLIGLDGGLRITRMQWEQSYPG